MSYILAGGVQVSKETDNFYRFSRSSQTCGNPPTVKLFQSIAQKISNIIKLMRLNGFSSVVGFYAVNGVNNTSFKFLPVSNTLDKNF
jgi:hypothetical protein